MAKYTKVCPHINTVQAGDETEVRTYCTDCNEIIKTQKYGKHKSKRI